MWYLTVFLILNARSENFLVRWDSMGMPKEIEKLNNLPALFTVSESQPTHCIPAVSVSHLNAAWNLWQRKQFASGSLLIYWKSFHWTVHIHGTWWTFEYIRLHYIAPIYANDMSAAPHKQVIMLTCMHGIRNYWFGVWWNHIDLYFLPLSTSFKMY